MCESSLKIRAKTRNRFSLLDNLGATKRIEKQMYRWRSVIQDLVLA